jgi:hypothetical protein
MRGGKRWDTPIPENALIADVEFYGRRAVDSSSFSSVVIDVAKRRTLDWLNFRTSATSRPPKEIGMER